MLHVLCAAIGLLVGLQAPPADKNLSEFIPGETGDLSFACGMSMLRGVVVVQ